MAGGVGAAVRALAPVLGAVLICLVIAEGTVRFFLPHLAVVPEAGQKPNRFSPDDVLGYRLDRTAHWVQNGDRGEFMVEYWSTPDGFRTAKPGTPPCAGDEVLFLGNSFVEGWGLPFEKSFLKIAEGALARGPRPLCLANFGMSGYSAAQSYLLLKGLLAKKARPAVFCFTPGTPYDDHDFLRGAGLDAKGLATGLDIMKLGMPRPGLPEPAALKTAEQIRPYLGGLALFRMVLRTLRNRYEAARVVPGDVETDRFFFTREGTDWRVPLADTMRHVDAMHDLCKAAGVPFLAVLIPYGHQVAAYEWREGRVRQKLAAGQLHPPAGLVDVEKHLTARAVPVLNLLDPLKRATRPDQPLFFQLDIHLNERGSQVAADELVRWLPGALAGK